MPKKHLIGDFKTRILPIFRRSSGSSAKSNTSSSLHSSGNNPRTRSKASLVTKNKSGSFAEAVPKEFTSLHGVPFPSPSVPDTLRPVDQQPPTPPHSVSYRANGEQVDNPLLSVVDATPDQDDVRSSNNSRNIAELDGQDRTDGVAQRHARPTRSQDLSLKNIPAPNAATFSQGDFQDYFGAGQALSPIMLYRKIWVKRSGASATLVQIGEDDLVDDARDKVLRKYANSLGRTFDSPDVTLRIIPRESAQHKHGNAERSLGPEESIARTLDAYFPGGQSVDDALIIDVPVRRTPRHSPRIYADNRPPENGADYFSVVPMAVNHSPHLPTNVSVAGSAGSGQQLHAISVTNTGHVPPLPSPGAGGRTGRHGGHRPKFGRTSTSSPTLLTSAVPHADVRQLGPPTPSAPALPTPPLSTAPIVQQKVSTPPPRVSSPRPTKNSKTKKPKRANTGQTPLPKSLLDGGVPPINVLIVEDNIINLKLLEAFMKRLKVRWHTAMNGRDAVTKWRAGGFHLVLMDIQLPVMNGLDATKEIRRLERVNGIGVLADKVGDLPCAGRTDDGAQAEGTDRLENQESFKSPVIIVALTASSLQSDRHEALAAGCNDFLTKPVSYVWLERKVMEWGCMQALIDFDGWRKWKDFSQDPPVAGKKGSDNVVSSKPNAAQSALPIKNRESASNSNSTGSSSDSASGTGPTIPATLAALNAKSESADTLDSISTTASGSSTETAAPLSSSTVTLTPQNSFHRQPSSQQAPKRVPIPHTTTLRASATDTALASAKQHPYGKTGGPPKEERRRKRSSLGHGGLQGVVEEI